jgi:hypothetical protein
VLKGLLAGGITMGVAAVFPEALVFPFYAGILGILAGVGPGLAMASQTRGATPQWVEAVAVMALGLVGLWINPLLLAVAWVIHGLWSLFLPRTVSEDDVPESYPSFALFYALLSAAFVAYMWAAVPA